ncbi:DUF3102 domain-containing protein [Roseomonas sp. SSH11]|uniref:DUF3102 domain-containing protein n=1 Tax=Pararoseomonas baculiformis TaxID=2820812 RepID=A0ABS4ADD3_9PROT|nr:DUF3102 domain-containing protein [Pararoseomonas baculiformis]MBP0445019.1 DUF3102 domain-containing protein [Pararoseomonas baculiformis]
MTTSSLAVLEERGVFPFDYSTLSSELAQQAQAAAKAINRIAARHVRLIGKHLLAAKEVIPHGSFMQWVESELGMNARTAQNYMTAARWLEGKPEPVSHLPAKVIYALASPATPASVVQEVVTAAAAGPLPEAEVIAHRIEVAKAEAREVKRLVAAKPGRTEQEAQKVVQRSRQNRTREREQREAEWAQQKVEREHRQQQFRNTLALWRDEHGPVLIPVLKQLLEMATTDSYGLTQALRDVLSSGEGAQ